MADDESAQPKNIQEFNQIAAGIFAQLYKAHPFAKTVDIAEVAALLGMTATTVMPSGRSFSEVFASTVLWLDEQGYTRTRGSIGVGPMTLSDKTFYAMNVVPPALKGPSGAELPSLPATTGTTGTALVQATEQAAQGRTKQFVDLAGTLIGSIIRSTLGSGG